MNEVRFCEVFSSEVGGEGCLVERIGDGQLVHFHHGPAETSAEIACGSVRFRAGQLSTSLARALKLPSSVAGTDDPQLFTTLQQIFCDAGGLCEGDAALLASFVLASWVAGRGQALCLNLIGPQAATAPVKALLSAVLRNPLSMADFRLSEMARLPAGMWTTVLLSGPSARALQELALSAGAEPVQILRGGNVELLPRCLGVVCTEEPAPLPAVRIQLWGRPVARFAAGFLESLEDRMRPSLLRFRFMHFANVASSSPPVGEFSPQVRAWAEVLVAAVSPFPGAAAEVFAALAPCEQEQASNLADSLPASLVEGLFLGIHADCSRLYVKDIARLTNLLREARGDGELTERAVGGVLRTLGFYPRRNGRGYRLDLSRAIRERVHRLALAMGVPQPVENSLGCPFCAALTPPGGGRLEPFVVLDEVPPVHNPEDVHLVHDIHDVHPVSEAIGLSEEDL